MVSVCCVLTGEVIAAVCILVDETVAMLLEDFCVLLADITVEDGFKDRDNVFRVGNCLRVGCWGRGVDGKLSTTSEVAAKAI